MDLVVLDSGPIRHSELRRFDDSDNETGLENSRQTAVNATYRLIEIDVADLEDTRHFPFEWRRPRSLVAAAGQRACTARSSGNSSPRSVG
jgi:hypothetical protein